MWAAVVTVGAIALFVAARAVFARGGLRQTVRGISAIGLGCSQPIAIAQAATAGRLIYWRFPTEYEGPLPFGPFVNRNHFATWVDHGRAAVFWIHDRARQQAGRQPRQHGEPAHASRTRMADGRTSWLTAAAAVMIGALLLSLSRSGIFSLAGGGVGLLALRPRAAGGRGVWLLAGRAGRWLRACASPAPTCRRLPIASRESGSGVRESRGRIWRDTLPLVRDFWLTGTGAGTYRTAMLYYQRVGSRRAVQPGAQPLSAGGVPRGPRCWCRWSRAALAALAARRSRPAFSRSFTGAYWIRAARRAGLIAVALQSLWETGLVMPANAALAAVLAAIAVHERSRR